MSLIKRSFGWQASQHLVRGALGMLIASVIARSVGERGLGILDSSFALVNLVAGCAGMGMQRIITRELCGNESEQNAIKGTSLGLTVISCFLGILIVNLISWGSPAEERLVVLCASLLLVTQPFGFLVSSVFESKGRLDLVGKVLFLGLIISSIARFTLAKVGADLPWLAFAYTIDVAISCGAGWLVASFIFKSWTRNWKFKASTAKALLKESWPLFLSSIAAFMYVSMDMLMLKWMSGYEETGFYGAAIRVSQIPLFIPGILASAFTSRLMAHYNISGEFAKTDLLTLTRLMVLLGFGVLTGGWLLGPLAIEVLYGEAFAKSGPILQIHVVGIFFMIVGSLRNHLLVLEGKGGLILLSDVCGAVSNLCLNFWLIPLHGAMGASWATAISYFTSFFLINLIHPDLRKYNKLLFSALLKKPKIEAP